MGTLSVLGRTVPERVSRTGAARVALRVDRVAPLESLLTCSPWWARRCFALHIQGATKAGALRVKSVRGSNGRSKTQSMSDETMPSEPDIMEPTLWRRNGWTARGLKKEDDAGL